MILKSIKTSLINWFVNSEQPLTTENIILGMNCVLENSTLNSANRNRLVEWLMQKYNIFQEVDNARRISDYYSLRNDVKENFQRVSVYHLDLLSIREFEKFIKWFFEQRVIKVELSKISGDSAVDLVVHKEGIKIAVKARRYDLARRVGISSIRDAVIGKTTYECEKSMVITNSYFTPRAVEEAKVLEVQLWDRDKIQEELSLLDQQRQNNSDVQSPKNNVAKKKVSQISSEGKKRLKNKQSLRITVQNSLVLLLNRSGEILGTILGKDSEWVKIHESKGATFKVTAQKSEKNVHLDVEAEWTEILS